MAELNNELMEVLAKLLGQDTNIQERVSSLVNAFDALKEKVNKAEISDLLPMKETDKVKIEKAGKEIGDQLEDMAKQSKDIDIVEVLGFDTTGKLAKQLRKSRQDLNDNIDDVTKKSRNYRRDLKGFDISNILGAPPNINPTTRLFAWWKFKRIQNNLLDKIGGIVDNIDPKSIEGKYIDLGRIFFNEPPKMGIWARSNFKWIRTKLLYKLDKMVDDKLFDIKNLVRDDKTINIGRIFFNESPKMGIWARWKFRSIRSKLLDQLSKIDIEKHLIDIDINKIFFNETPSMTRNEKKRWNKIRSKYLDDIEKQTKHVKKDEDKNKEDEEPIFAKKFESLFKNNFNDFIWRPGQSPIKFSSEDTIIGAKKHINQLAPAQHTTTITEPDSMPEHEDQKTMFEKAQPVKIAEFSDEVQEKYKKWFDGIELEQEEDTKEEEQQGFFSKLFAGLLGLLGLKAGAGGLIAGLGTKLLAIFGIKAGAGGLIGMLGGLLKKTIFGIGGVFFKGLIGTMKGMWTIGGIIGKALMMLFKSPLMWPVLAGILGTAIGNKLADWQSKQRMEEAAEKGRQREGEHKRAMVIWKAMADLEMRTYMTPKTMRALRAVQEGKADEMEQRLHDTIIEQINKRREEDKKQNLKEIAPNNNLNMVKNIIENSAAQKLNDFIWRPGEAPAKISPQDTLLGAKDGIHLKEGKDIFFGIKDVSKDIMDMKTILHEDFQQLTKTLITSIKEKQTTSPPSAHLPGIPGDYGRPIHEYRTRTRGYV
jgi:hypothetical protein